MLYEMRAEESLFWNEGEPHVIYQHTYYTDNKKGILEERIILKHYLT